MKKNYFIILFLLLISNLILSQTGTIKIAKPKPSTPAKDTTIIHKRSLTLIATIGSNYTFKKNNKYGFTGRITFPLSLYKNHSSNLYSGLEYSRENRYYALSPYNKITATQEIPHSRSQNTSVQLKIPIGITYHLHYGSAGHLRLSAELLPEYLLKTNDQYSRLNYSDFNQFNLAAGVSIGIHIIGQFSLNVQYSKDLFENLKNRELYDKFGTVLGKQGSKTNLLVLSLNFNMSWRVVH